MLNRIRRENPALQTHLGIRFHHISNDSVLCFSKSHPSENDVGIGSAIILVAISLDPFNEQYGEMEVPHWQLGLPDEHNVEVSDLIHGHRFVWNGNRQHIRLSPHELPFAIWRIEQQGVQT